MKNPTRALTLLDFAQTLVGIVSAATVAITVMELSNVDLESPLTMGGFLSIAAALALGYVVAGFVDTLVTRVARPYRQRLQDVVAEQTWLDFVPGESRAIAVSIRMFLNDLQDGLPCAVAMTRPGGRMPVTGAEWIDYTTSDSRHASLALAEALEADRPDKMSGQELACRRLQAVGDRIAGERGRRAANRVSAALGLGRIEICTRPDCPNCSTTDLT